MEKGLKPALITVGVGLIGYEAYQLTQLVRNFDYEINDFKFVKSSKGSVFVQFNVNFQNNSTASLPLNRVSGVVKQRGQVIGRFSTIKSVLLKANQVTAFPVQVQITSNVFLKQLVESVSVKDGVVDIDFIVSVRPKILFGLMGFPLSKRITVSVDLKPYLSDIIDVYTRQNEEIKTLGVELFKLLEQGISLTEAIKLLKG